MRPAIGTGLKQPQQCLVALVWTTSKLMLLNHGLQTH
jgi:hypothetical protein